MSLDEVKKDVLNPKKPGTILVTIPRQTIDVNLKRTNAINHTLQANCFPDILRQSEVIPVYKQLDPLEEEKNRPVSLPPRV